MDFRKSVRIGILPKEVIEEARVGEAMEMIRPLILKVMEIYEKHYKTHSECYNKFRKEEKITKGKILIGRGETKVEISKIIKERRKKHKELIKYQKVCKNSSRQVVLGLKRVLKELDKVKKPLNIYHHERGFKGKMEI